MILIIIAIVIVTTVIIIHYVIYIYIYIYYTYNYNIYIHIYIIIYTLYNYNICNIYITIIYIHISVYNCIYTHYITRIFLLENYKSVPNSGDEMWNVFTLLGWRIWWPRGAACCWWPWNMMDSARRRDHPTRREADGGWIRLPPDTCRYQKLMCPALKWRSSDKKNKYIKKT